MLAYTHTTNNATRIIAALSLFVVLTKSDGQKMKIKIYIEMSEEKNEFLELMFTNI